MGSNPSVYGVSIAQVIELHFIEIDPRDGMEYGHPLVRLKSEEKKSQCNTNKHTKGAFNANYSMKLLLHLTEL